MRVVQEKGGGGRHIEKPKTVLYNNAAALGSCGAVARSGLFFFFHSDKDQTAAKSCAGRHKRDFKLKMLAD